jgi:hypothetical protein
MRYTNPSAVQFHALLGACTIETCGGDVLANSGVLASMRESDMRETAGRIAGYLPDASAMTVYAQSSGTREER